LFEPISVTPPFLEVYQAERGMKPFLRVSRHPLLIMPDARILLGSRSDKAVKDLDLFSIAGLSSFPHPENRPSSKSGLTSSSGCALICVTWRGELEVKQAA
jgi:hypothetical protein